MMRVQVYNVLFETSNNVFCCSTIMQTEIILSLQCSGPNLPCGLHLVRWLLSLAGIERRAQIAGYTRTQPYNQAAYQNTRLVQYTVDDLLLFFLSVSWTCNLFDYENTSHIFQMKVEIVSSIFLGAKRIVFVLFSRLSQ